MEWRQLFQHQRQWSVAALVIAAGVFLGAVWPTRYRYEHLSRGRYSYFARLDRFSGRVQSLDGTEWLPRTDAGYDRVRDSAYAAGWQTGTRYLLDVSQQLALPDTACLRTAVQWAADLAKDSVSAQRASTVIRRYCTVPVYSPENPFRP